MTRHTLRSGPTALRAGKAHVAGDDTPEWAAEITDLDPELIRTTARVMADTLPRNL
jgi:anaerobic selenocysteine-containing dehydrogenase